MSVCNTTNASFHTTQGSIKQSKKKKIYCLFIPFLKKVTSPHLQRQSDISLNLGSCPDLPPSYICQMQTVRPSSRAILKKSSGSSMVPRLAQDNRWGLGKTTWTSSQSSRRHLSHLSHRKGTMHRATFLINCINTATQTCHCILHRKIHNTLLLYLLAC